MPRFKRPNYNIINCGDAIEDFGTVDDTFVDEVIEEADVVSGRELNKGIAISYNFLAPEAIKDVLDIAMNSLNFSIKYIPSSLFFDLTLFENFFYTFLSFEESELCYFTFRQFPVQAISAFTNVSIAALTYRRRRIRDKFDSFVKRVIPLIKCFDKHSDLLKDVLSHENFFFLKLAISRMSKSVFSEPPFNLSIASTTTKFKEIKSILQRDGRFIELVNSLSLHFSFGSLGREFYTSKSTRVYRALIGRYGIYSIQLISIVSQSYFPHWLSF